jgi:hypothetical protein
VRKSPQRLQFRTEDQLSVEPAVIERLDPDRIADQRQGSITTVPDRKGEDADQTARGPFDAPGGAGFDQDFGIGPAAEDMPRSFQLGP